MAEAQPSPALTPEERVALSRRRIPREGLRRFLRALDPGARLLTCRRLRGGISTLTAEVRYRDSAGEDRSVVARVFIEANESSSPEDAEREWRTLQALAATSLPTPAPLLLDRERACFGAPAMLVSRLPGRPVARPRDRDSWLERLARALHRVHSLRPEDADLSHMLTHHRQEITDRIMRPNDELAAVPLGHELWRTLQARVHGISWSRPSLVHEDFWPGNTLWQRGRLTGIVDWSSADIGERSRDVAQCRADLALMYGLDWAERFLRHYERAAGEALSDIWFWDLDRARGPIIGAYYFAAGYHDLGLTGLSPALMNERLEAFVRQALARSGA